MTDQHPLTDDIIRYDKKLGCQDLSTWIYTENDLRAAADWQLEQVIDWMRHSVHQDWYLEAIGHCGAEMGIDLVIEELEEAMRPTTTPTETIS